MKRIRGSWNIQDSHLADGQAVIFPIQLNCITFHFCNCSSVEAVGGMCWWCAVSAGRLLTPDTCVCVRICAGG